MNSCSYSPYIIVQGSRILSVCDSSMRILIDHRRIIKPCRSVNLAHRRSMAPNARRNNTPLEHRAALSERSTIKCNTIFRRMQWRTESPCLEVEVDENNKKMILDSL